MASPSSRTKGTIFMPMTTPSEFYVLELFIIEAMLIRVLTLSKLHS